MIQGSLSSGSLFQLRRLFVRVIAILGISLGGVGFVPVLLITLRDGRTLNYLISPVVIILVCSAALILVDRQRLRLASQLVILGLLGVSLVPPPAFLIIAVVAALAVAALGSRLEFALSVVFLVIRAATVSTALLQTETVDFERLGGEVIAPMLVILIVALSTRYFIYSAEKTTAEAVRSAVLLQSTADVAQIATEVTDLQLLFNRIINLIRERYSLYHVQIFMVDESREYARLAASTGEAGQRLLAQNHRLAIGSRSVIGQAAAGGQPIIARDSDPENVRVRNELLPETRAEMAMPIIDGGVVIGVLDLQSTEVNAFDSEGMLSAQSALTNLITSAIRNATLFEQQLAVAQQNAELLKQTQANLDEIQRLNRELTSQAWRDFLRETRMPESITLDAKGVQFQGEWTPLLRQAVAGDVVREAGSGSYRVALPLLLRGQAIGAVELESAEPLDEKSIQTLQAVLDRFSFSLENARLYQEAQSATAKETRVNQIAARYERVNSMDDLLRITLQELTETLGAEAGTIRLGTLTPAPKNGGSAT